MLPSHFTFTSTYSTHYTAFVCRMHNFGTRFKQSIELNRWHRGTPQSIILSHGFTFHHLVNPHTHTSKHTHALIAHIISAAVKGKHLRAMITATDCCSVNTDLCRRTGGLNIIPACWGGSTEQGVRQRAKARLQGKSQPSLKWIMPLCRIAACLTSCISVKERRFNLYKHVFSQRCSFSSITSSNLKAHNINR